MQAIKKNSSRAFSFFSRHKLMTALVLVLILTVIASALIMAVIFTGGLAALPVFLIPMVAFLEPVILFVVSSFGASVAMATGIVCGLAIFSLGAIDTFAILAVYSAANILLIPSSDKENSEEGRGSVVTTFVDPSAVPAAAFRVGSAVTHNATSGDLFPAATAVAASSAEPAAASRVGSAVAYNATSGALFPAAPAVTASSTVPDAASRAAFAVPTVHPAQHQILNEEEWGNIRTRINKNLPDYIKENNACISIAEEPGNGNVKFSFELGGAYAFVRFLETKIRYGLDSRITAHKKAGILMTFSIGEDDVEKSDVVLKKDIILRILGLEEFKPETSTASQLQT